MLESVKINWLMLCKCPDATVESSLLSPKAAYKVMNFSFKVGVNAPHSVDFAFDQFIGNLEIKVRNTRVKRGTAKGNGMIGRGDTETERRGECRRAARTLGLLRRRQTTSNN